jgi:hypothetical protein
MNRHIDFDGKSVILRSEGGPEVTEIDCEGADFAFLVEQGVHEVIEGLTVRNGYNAYTGGAMMIKTGASASVRHCRFVDNCAGAGGVLFCGAETGQTDFQDCLFLRNSASGSAVAHISLANVEFTDCDFVQNISVNGSGVFYVVGSGMGAANVVVTGCLFRENSGPAAAVLSTNYRWGIAFYAHDCAFEENESEWGVIRLDFAWCEISQCIFARNVVGSVVLGRYYAGGGGSLSGSTFVENVAPLGIFDPDFDDPVSTTIVAFTLSGPAILDEDPPPFSCCDFYGNEGGDWVGAVAGQLGVDGNICEPPLFCGDANPECPYALHANSLCAAANSGGCGTIGVWDEGCAATATDMSTWGSIKARYR